MAKIGTKLKMALPNVDKGDGDEVTKVAKAYSKPGSKLKSFGKHRKVVD